MELPLKPKPTQKYLELGAKQAAMVAWAVSKKYSPDGKADMGIFRDWTKAHLAYAKKATANL